MPKGIFLLIHDELKGPQIKSSYYTSPMSLPQEFISKLYMSHAGFKSSSHMEIKLGRSKMEETEESKRIANKWNEFLIEAQKSPSAFVYILNYVVILLDQCAKQNNKSFPAMCSTLEEIHKKGLWRDFEHRNSIK